MNADGSPTLLSGTPATAAPALAQSDTAVAQATTKSDWGLYLLGDKIIEPDSIIALDYRREWVVADFPLEDGAFASYDKVVKPFDVRLRMTKGGSDIERATFIAAIETIAESLSLLDVVTPDKTYLSVTIQSIGYQKTAVSGVSLISFDVGLRQVRVTASSALTAVQQPGSADSINGGTVQPQATPPAVVAPVIAKVKKALAPAAAAGAASN